MQLLKYDFKSLWAICLPAYALTALGFCWNGVLGFFLENMNSDFPYELASILEMIYDVTNFFICLLVVLTGIWIVTDFYKTVFGKIGYLTHTLPVKAEHILLSKVFSGMCMFALSSLIAGAALFILENLRNGWYWDYWFDSDLLQFGISILFAGVAGVLLQMLSMFLAIALAHMTKHKVGLSVVFYLVLYHLVGNIPVFGTILVFYNYNGANLGFFITFWIYGVLALLISPLLYFATLGIMKKKLNLE
ncbi:MAG: hypothetical protein R3Y63_12175 [Eubacteriales bacterium]